MHERCRLSRNPSPTLTPGLCPEMSRGLANFPSRNCDSGNKIANVLKKSKSNGGTTRSRLPRCRLGPRTSPQELIDFVTCNISESTLDPRQIVRF
jgi:hypothetical protein